MKNKIEIGIMGGRLSNSINNEIQKFPKYTWRKEFELAKKCEFSKIEWVFDELDNPILNHEEVKEMINLSSKHNVKINSLCADYFMNHRLSTNNEDESEKNVKILKKIIEKCHQIGIKILEIPLVDQSSLANKDDENNLRNNLQKIIPLIEKYDLILNLETDLPPKQFKELIESFSSKNIKANYDVGNSISLGYNVVNELNILKKLISNIHIKDRCLHGNTVFLGTGDVDFELFFKTLKKIDYNGDLIIQGAREDEIRVSPFNTCEKYLNFVRQYALKYLG